MKIPKSWDDIKIGNYANYLIICSDKAQLKEGLLTRKVSALLGISIEEARKISIEDVNKIIRLMASKLPHRLMLTFKLKGRRYRPMTDARKLDGEKFAAVELAQSRGVFET